MSGPVIWADGIMGAGKTTLVKALSTRLGLPAHLELLECPFLEKYYEDPKRWALTTQIDMLLRRYATHRGIAAESSGALIDRALPGDRAICSMHLASENISPSEGWTYEMVYLSLIEQIPPPALLVFLDVLPETALRRVRLRGRSEETDVDLDYLTNQEYAYRVMLEGMRTLPAHPWSSTEIVSLDWNADNPDMDAAAAAVRRALDSIGRRSA